MGRKAISKPRKDLSPKMKNWLLALADSIKNEDLKNLNMDRMAKLTQISKSTIYEYFSSKEEILLACIKQKINHLSQFDFKAINNKQDVLDNYTDLINWICRHVDDISISFLNQIKNYFKDIWEIIEDYMAMLLSKIKYIYEIGIKLNAFQTFDLSMMVAMDKFFIMEYLSESKRSGSNNLESLINEYVKLKFQGITRVP